MAQWQSETHPRTATSRNPVNIGLEQLQTLYNYQNTHWGHRTSGKHCTKNCPYTTPLPYVKGVKGHIWPYLWSLLTRVKGHFCFESNVIHFWLESKGIKGFVKYMRWLARASKVPLLTFDSSQRHDNFDASQSCVKADVKVPQHLWFVCQR